LVFIKKDLLPAEGT